MYVKDVEDRSNTPKGCTGYVKAETESFPTIPSNPMYVEACQRCRRCVCMFFSHLRHLQHTGIVQGLNTLQFKLTSGALEATTC